MKKKDTKDTDYVWVAVDYRGEHYVESSSFDEAFERILDHYSANYTPQKYHRSFYIAKVRSMDTDLPTVREALFRNLAENALLKDTLRTSEDVEAAALCTLHGSGFSDTPYTLLVYSGGQVDVVGNLANVLWRALHSGAGRFYGVYQLVYPDEIVGISRYMKSYTDMMIRHNINITRFDGADIVMTVKVEEKA